MSNKVRIGVASGDKHYTVDSSTTAYVVWGQNHLLQKRQFAFDGQRWFYQPDTRTMFIQVNPMDVPENVLSIMSAEHNFSREQLGR